MWTFFWGVNSIINRENKFFVISPILKIFWLEGIFQNLFILMYFAHKMWYSSITLKDSILNRSICIWSSLLFLWRLSLTVTVFFFLLIRFFGGFSRTAFFWCFFFINDAFGFIFFFGVFSSRLSFFSTTAYEKNILQNV